jgi:hypothetical protein
MTEMSGIEFVAEIRKWEREKKLNSKLPIVI